MDTPDNLCLELVKSYVSPSPIIFDVGANLGDFTAMVLEKFGTNAEIYTFEPNPHTFDKLCQRQFNNATIVHNRLVISDISADAVKLYAPESDTNTTSALTSLIDRGVFHEWTDSSVKEYEMPSRTIDDYCASQGINHINYLKIDVEGYELNVLKGAAQMLAAKAIWCGQFEYGTTFKDAGVSLQDVVRFLNDYEYGVFYKDFNNMLSIDVIDTYDWVNFVFCPVKAKQV